MSANNNVLKMNDEQTLNFIDCYQKEEVLWNTKSKLYRNRAARSEAVERILKALNIEGFRPDHVLSKFKNLRSSYCQELKKIAVSKKSGIFAEDIYVPNVVWFNKMNSFLKPYITMKETCSNYIMPNGNKSNSIEKTDDLYLATTKINTNSQLQAINYKTNLNMIETILNTSYNNDTCSIITVKNKEFQSQQKSDWNLKKRKLETPRSSFSETDTMLTAVKQLDRITKSAQKLNQNNKKEDSFDQFGKYIASVLRILPIKKACLLQQKMTNIVMKEIIENETNIKTSNFGSPNFLDDTDPKITDLSNS